MIDCAISQGLYTAIGRTQPTFAMDWAKGISSGGHEATEVSDCIRSTSLT